MFEYEIQKEKLESLINVIKKINSTIELDILLFTIMESSKEVIESEASSLLLIDPKTGELYFNVATGEKRDLVKEVRIPIGKGIGSIVAQSGKSMIVNDAQNDDRVYKKLDGSGNMKTRNVLCVPLTVKDKIIGVLEVINSSKSEGYNSDDCNLLTMFADFAAISINNRELYYTTRSRLSQITAIYQISQVVNHTENVKKLINTTVDIISENMQTKRISIIMRDEESDTYKFLTGTDIPKAVLKHNNITINDNVLDYILKNNSGVFSPNIEMDPRFGPNKRLRYNKNSFISVPMNYKKNIVGFISVSERKANIPFTRDDFIFLSTVSQEFIEGYFHLVLGIEMIEKSRLDTEVEVIAKLQNDILPSTFPKYRDISFSAESIPCRKVGGDFYDLFEQSDSAFTVLIADISGKGLPATVFMSICRSLLRVHMSEKKNTKDILTASNRYIYKDSKAGMFATAFIMHVNTKTRKITYSNAGHFEQYLYSTKSRKLIPLRVDGKPLGVLPSEKYQEAQVQYNPGDIAVLFTDGIIEAFNRKGQVFGEERLKKLIKANHRMSPEDLKHKIIMEVKRYSGSLEQADDLTLFIIKF
ncbi:SpoIIE family protein phosphatase [Spirochaetota bacterium]